MQLPPRETWQLGTRHVGRRVLVYDVTDSTNDRAAELAADPANAGTAVLADAQTAGRGQYGRTWQGQPGGSVLLSVLLFPPPALRRPAVLIAWAAVAVGEAVLRAAGLQARIKWPNDLLLRGKKVCGILTESKVPTRAPDGDLPVVVGIGLNVNQDREHFEQLGLPAATSLAIETGRGFDVAAVARQLLEELDAGYDLLMDGDLGTLEACWKWRVGLLGRPVTAECTDGTITSGRLREMAFTGLELSQPDGSVRLLPPESVRHIG